jgi:hypothetical protein
MLQIDTIVDALIKQQKEFDMLVVPDSGHQLPSYALKRPWDYFDRNLRGEGTGGRIQASSMSLLASVDRASGRLRDARSTCGSSHPQPESEVFAQIIKTSACLVWRFFNSYSREIVAVCECN